MEQKPIKLKEDVYARLTKVRGKLSIALSENVTYNETVDFLIKSWEEREDV